MPLKFMRKLHPTGDKGESRMLVLPKGWWMSSTPPTRNVKIVVDKAVLMCPEGMTDEELLECVLFILKQTFSPEHVVDIFKRIFDVEIVEEDNPQINGKQKLRRNEE